LQFCKGPLARAQIVPLSSTTIPSVGNFKNNLDNQQNILNVGAVFHNDKGTDSILSRKKVSHESQNRYIDVISININSRIQDFNSRTGHRLGFGHQYEESILKFERLPCMLTIQNHSTPITLTFARGVARTSARRLGHPARAPEPLRKIFCFGKEKVRFRWTIAYNKRVVSTQSIT